MAIVSSQLNIIIYRWFNAHVHVKKYLNYLNLRDKRFLRKNNLGIKNTTTACEDLGMIYYAPIKLAVSFSDERGDILNYALDRCKSCSFTKWRTDNIIKSIRNFTILFINHKI